MGVEPTGAGFAGAHTVLKTGEATGPLPPPCSMATIPRCDGPAESSIAIAAVLPVPRSHQPDSG